MIGDEIVGWHDFLSIKITLAPPKAACLAAAEPAGPAPITKTSVSIIISSK